MRLKTKKRYDRLVRHKRGNREREREEIRKGRRDTETVVELDDSQGGFRGSFIQITTLVQVYSKVHFHSHH